MKILMGVPAPGLKGGPPTHLPYLVEYFRKNNDFDIHTFYYGSKSAQNHENFFVKVFNTSKVLLHFIRLITVFKPDIIHLNSSFDKKSIFRDLPFSVICKLFNTPVLFKVHGSHYDLLLTKSPAYRVLIRIYFWGSSRVGVLSEFEKNEFIVQFGNSSKLIVVKNIVPGINCKSLERISYTNTIKKYDVLFVSRIEEGKGLEDLLLSMPHILKSLPDLFLGIAGSGNSMKKCMDLADELKIQENIEWLGYLKNEDLNKVFNQSKIFVFTSHFPEGMPMSMIEALRNGLPVITSRTRFALSYLKEEENVIFIEKNNPDELSEKVINLLIAGGKQEKMRKNNFNFLCQFTQDKVGEEFADIYMQMKNRS